MCLWLVLAYNRGMDKLTREDAQKIMSVFATLVVMGVITIDDYLNAMVDIEDCIGLDHEYISSWDTVLHLNDLLEDDED